MTLKEVASISGKSGLFKILKPTRNGVIVETISKEKKKASINSTQKVSVLEEISIYVTGREEESIPLIEVFQAIKSSKVDLKDKDLADKDQAYELMESVLPDYDEDRVYHSDIKKLFSWYSLLNEYAPDALKPEKKEEEKAEADSKEETPKEEKA